MRLESKPIKKQKEDKLLLGYSTSRVADEPWAVSQISLASKRTGVSGGDRRGAVLALCGKEPDRKIDCYFNVI